MQPFFHLIIRFVSWRQCSFSIEVLWRHERNSAVVVIRKSKSMKRINVSSFPLLWSVVHVTYVTMWRSCVEFEKGRLSVVSYLLKGEGRRTQGPPPRLAPLARALCFSFLVVVCCKVSVALCLGGRPSMAACMRRPERLWAQWLTGWALAGWIWGRSPWTRWPSPADRAWESLHTLSSAVRERKEPTLLRAERER